MPQQPTPTILSQNQSLTHGNITFSSCKLDSVPISSLFSVQRCAAQAPFWPKDKCIVVPEKKKAPLPSPPNSTGPEAQTSSRPEKLSQQGQLLEKALLAAAAAVLEHAQELDEWDQR